MKKGIKKIVSFMLFILMSIVAVPTNLVVLAATADGKITKVSDIGVKGSKVYIYQPKKPSTNGLMTPIVVLYGSKSYKNETEAKKALIASGIKELSDSQGFNVYLPNQANGTSWDGNNDLKVYNGILDKTSDAGYMPNGIKDGKYAGDKTLIYLIGEGKGGDFINKSLTQRQETVIIPGVYSVFSAPAAVLTFNSTSLPGDLPIAMPSFIVNGSQALINKYKAINSSTVKSVVDGVDVYKNKIVNTNVVKTIETNMVMTATSKVKNGYDAKITKKAWNMLLSKERRRTIDADKDTALQLYLRPDYKSLGINVVSHLGQYVSNDNGSGRKHTWVEYIPESVKKSGKKVPLVITMHGGGNNLLWQAETSKWPEIAAKEGFIVVSLQHQDSAIDNESPETIIDLLKYLEKKLPVDTTRVYASGFSMGSVMTFKLGVMYPEYFAGIAPCDGSEGLTLKKNVKMPVFYTAGVNDGLMVFPHRGDIFTPKEDYNKANKIDTMLETMYKMNGVNYPGFDSKYGVWGIKPDKAYDITSSTGANVLTISEINSQDGVAYTGLNIVSHQMHTVLPDNSYAAWNFLKKFSRNADGTISVAK